MLVQVLEELEHTLMQRKGKHQKGGEEIAFCCPFHQDDNPSCHYNTEKKTYHCKGCSASGNWRDLCNGLGIQIPVNHNGNGRPPSIQSKKKDRPQKPKDPWMTLEIAPPEAMVLDHKLTDTTMWPYRSASDETFGYACRRINPRTGRKDHLYFIPQKNTDTGEYRWTWGAMPQPRPLFNLDLLYQNPSAPILFVEGEKAATAAAELFPNGEFIATTTPNGCNSAHLATYDYLFEDRTVYIWPDNDEAGQKYADAVIKQIQNAPFSDRPVKSILKVSPPEEFPKGWDIADPLPEGAPSIKQLLQEALPIGVETCGDRQIDQALKESKLPIAEEPAQTIKALQIFAYIIQNRHPDKVETAQKIALKLLKNTNHPNAYLHSAFDLALVEEVEVQKFIPYGYSIAPDGVYYDPGKEDSLPVHISSYVRVEAQTHDQQEKNAGRLIRAVNNKGRLITWVAPARDFSRKDSSITDALADNGVIIYNDKLLRRYLNEFTPERYELSVNKLGWDYGYRRYIFRDKVYGSDPNTRIHFQSNSPTTDSMRPSCDLYDWQKNVAQYAEGNSRLILALCTSVAAAFTGKYIKQGCGIHFHGPSSSGKSTVLYVAGSVWGGGTEAGFLKPWRATANGLEMSALIHNNSVLPLDEISQMGGKELGESIYMLLNGMGKARATRDATPREVYRWCLMVLSSGEQTIADKMSEGRAQPRAGQLVRMIEIPAQSAGADKNASYGAFEDLHGFRNGADFSRHLVENSIQYYGIAARHVVEEILADWENTKECLDDYIQNFMDQVIQPDADGQVNRVLKSLSAISAAGEWAIAKEILPWEPGTADHAVRQCFQDWILARGGTGAHEAKQALDNFRLQFEQRHVTHFHNTITNDVGRHGSDGYVIHQETDGKLKPTWCILPQVFKKVYCAGFSTKFVCDILAERGILKRGKQGLNSTPTRVSNAGLTQEVFKSYKITDKIFDY